MNPQQSQTQQAQSITRDQARTLLLRYLTNENLIKHSHAAEAAMKGVYRRLHPGSAYSQPTEEVWGITGLLHDADYEMAKGHPEKHGLLLFEKEPNSIPQDIARAIKAHNYEYTQVQPVTQMEWAIACCDQLTGLIVACALVHPDKKLASLTPDFVLKRYGETSFARGAKRESIALCEQKLGIKLPEFVAIVLQSMKTIAPQLGL